MAVENPSGVSPKHGGESNPAHLAEETIREELNRVLASHEFRTSKRSQEFLRYVVDHTLRGQADLLKERTIGVDVFGRPADYDPSEDATVRVKAGEVRKRLGLYYAEQGARNPVRIELPSGAYVPEFRAGESAIPAVMPADSQLVAAPAKVAYSGPRVRLGPRVMAGAALLCFLAGGIIWWRTRPGNTPLDQFWAPVLTGNAPVLVCAAYVPVYRVEPDGNPHPRPEDFVLLNDQFVGGGDLVAISRLTAMLTRLRRPYRLKVGNDVSFQDLRTGPAVLVGYSYTRWREISQEMRFFIDTTRLPVGITDNGKPTPWALPRLPPDRRTDEDYAIVSRVFHPDTHAMLVEVAGITQYGTDGGADLITKPDLLAEGLSDAPSGWQTKNMQLVLHVKVIAGSPSSPKIVAKYFW
ncbi:MAG: hypothetical protein C5B51_30165 [Terriglobia bacterium]|nr:MAG: hypothetical protein C5B51_30165 [Terriglobia bacterium]